MPKSGYIKIAILLLSLSFSGCASTSAFQEAPRIVPLGETVEDDSNRGLNNNGVQLVFDQLKHQFRIDVFGWGGDDWVDSWNIDLSTPHVYQMKSVIINNPTRVDTSDSSESRILKTKRGYRVQLANVTDEARARGIERRAKSLFENIYMTFNSPNYKVRGGDFLKRSDADKAAKEAKLMGFRGAWVVPDKINIYE